ncbi:MAG: T9SS type A sorting domain-containing protein [Bacteroidota bacterium]
MNTGWGQTYTDNATSYTTGGWGPANPNNSNSCSNVGFGDWTFTYGANTGTFIGNPADNGMGISGIGNTAFGMFATGAAGYCNAYRSIRGGMQVGDQLSFYWAINWDALSGAKGFDLRNGGTNIFNVNNGGNATITTSNGTAFTAFGTTPMLVTLTRTSSTAYSFTMTARDGGATYSTTINSASTIDIINFYIGNQNDANGNRNMYLNAFQLLKPRYRSRASGNWGDAANWEISTNGGSTWVAATSAPSGTFDAITIRNGHSITLNTSVSASSLTIDAGGTFNNGTGQTITIAACNGTITNNGTFNRNTGTVTFSSNGTVSGPVNFHNLNTSGGLTLGAALNQSTIHGVFTLNNGGFIASAPPKYASGSTLVYNTGGTFNRSDEWPSGNTVETVPHHVTVRQGTTLNLDVKTSSGNNSHYDDEGRTLLGDLDLYGTLTMGGNSGTMAEDLIVFNGNVTIRSTGGLILGSQKPSEAKIGDIQLGGNWLHETGGTFDASRRAVIFNGASTTEQTVTFNGTEIFGYFIVNKSNNGTVKMLADAFIYGANQGSIFQLLNGHLDLNGKSMTLQIRDTINNVNQNILIEGSAGNLTRRVFNSSATAASFNITHYRTNPIPAHITTVTRNSPNLSLLLFDSNIIVTVGSSTGNVGINFGSGITTINGTLRINARGFVDVNPPTYATNSLLQYNIGSDYSRNAEWNAASGPGYPFNVQTSLSGTRLIAGGAVLSGAPANTNTALNMAGSLTVDQSTTFDMTNSGNHDMTVPLIVTLDINLNGTLIASGNTNGNVQMGRNWTRNISTGTFTHNTRRLIFNSSLNSMVDLSAAGTEIFYAIETAKALSTNTITLNKPTDISNAAYFGTGTIVSSTTNLLSFYDGTDAIGESDNSFVDGPVRKIGDDAFSFPVGKPVKTITPSIYNAAGLTGGWRPIDISAPGNVADSFIAEFVHFNANLIGPVTLPAAPVLQGVSYCEYWGLKRSSATNVNVTLYWKPKSVCNPSTPYILDPNAVVVAVSDNGTPFTHPSGQWNYYGADSRTGNALEGSVTWNAVPLLRYKNPSLSNYGGYTPFTLGTTNWRLAPLPFELKNFKAVAKNTAVQLGWLVNNNNLIQHYTIERSRDGISFESLKKVYARNTESTVSYNDIDPTPFNGWVYYRLRITEMSGQVQYSAIQKVWIGGSQTTILVTPKPAKNLLWVNLSKPEEVNELSIVSSVGQLLYKQNRLQSNNQIDISRLQPGVYYVRLIGKSGVVTEAFVKE